MGPGCRWYVGVQLLVREVAGWLGELRVTDWPVRGNRVGRKWRNGLELPSPSGRIPCNIPVFTSQIFTQKNITSNI